IQRAFLSAAHRFVGSHAEFAAWTEVLAGWGDVLDRLPDNWPRLSDRLDWALKRRLLERVLARQESDWTSVQVWLRAIDVTNAWTPADQEADVIAALRRDRPDLAAAFEEYVREADLNPTHYWRQRALQYRLQRLDLDYHELNLDAERPGLFYRLQRDGAVA